ncbi:MAG: glycerophosphodiester phosphodiesterase [Nitrososphaerales archaeon]|nr:glycerophosphodiester phosphodiesterase [Nitrososphaerales archaeon]
MMIVAHRGASAYEPENTLRAIEKAIELGANMVEVDVRPSKDGHIVVIHDDSVDRTTNGEGYVKNMTLKELKKLDAGIGERVPTLQEVIGAVRRRVVLVIEIKVLNFEEAVVRTVEKEGMEKEVMITSFYHPVLERVKKIDSIIKTGVIFKCHPIRSAELALNARADVLFPEYKYTSKEMVEEARKSNLEIYPWTVDDQALADRFIKMGVNGIVTNKPDILKSRKQ